MAVRKNNRTKEQGAETKRQLFECADKLFLQDDYKNVSVEAITRMAGVTKGTFYVHFESKDALYVELFSSYAQRLDEGYQAFLDALPQELSSSERLLAFAEGIIDIMITKVGYERIQTVYRLQLADTVNTEVINGYGRKLYLLFQNVLEIGIRQGEFKASPSGATLARQFVMAIRGLTYEWCIQYPNFDFKQETLLHIRLLLEGIRTKA
ncbi:HTH-type transcriptional regulator AcrR [bioreactor metagenome]|uniref:HTH-type transcriptional regulator AcrR n=1 Tax=bioreactor metagenome TaxID=1076179 RepID=A0A645APZ5_9ZZZZ